MFLVLDSSVIVKWLNTDREENVEEANSLLHDILENDIDVIVPELAKYEIGNVLLLSKRISHKDISIALETLHSLPITFIPESLELAEKTHAIASAQKITYYDAAFLALAEEFRATLITANIKHQKDRTNQHVISLNEYSFDKLE